MFISGPNRKESCKYVIVKVITINLDNKQNGTN